MGGGDEYSYDFTYDAEAPAEAGQYEEETGEDALAEDDYEQAPGDADEEPEADAGALGAITLVPVAVTEGSAAIVLESVGGSGEEFLLAVDVELMTYIEEALKRAGYGPPAAARAAAGRTSRAPVDAPSVAAPQPLETRTDTAAPSQAGSQAPAPSGRFESKLSPREIQRLLRQGRSVASIARRAGVPVWWVERFEAPIAAERAGMARRARAASLVRPRLGRSAAPLGDAVRANLAGRGLQVDQMDFDGAWDSVKHPRNGSWVVSFSFVHRRRQQVAQWEFRPDRAEVHALNRIATELGWLPPPRKRGG